MEVILTPDQEIKLRYLSENSGKDVAELVEEVLTHALEERVYHLERIQQARASYDQGAFVQHDEVLTMLQRRMDEKWKSAGPSKQ